MCVVVLLLLGCNVLVCVHTCTHAYSCTSVLEVGWNRMPLPLFVPIPFHASYSQWFIPFPTQEVAHEVI